jgi:GT2 family glycosyltransferase
MNIESTLLRLITDRPPMITGSRCDIGKNPSWIEKFWFKPLVKEKANYMNSGHFIIEKKYFDKMGGFDESLTTAEDYEFCERAKKNGGLIINNFSLRVIHEGYPKTVYDFFKRERWHGFQDMRSLKHILQSKVAVASIIYSVSLITALIAALLLNIGLSLKVILIAIFMCLIATAQRAKNVRLSVLEISITVLLYNVYFFSRCVAFLDSMRNIFGKPCVRHTRRSRNRKNT